MQFLIGGRRSPQLDAPQLTWAWGVQCKERCADTLDLKKGMAYYQDHAEGENEMADSRPHRSFRYGGLSSKYVYSTRALSLMLNQSFFRGYDQIIGSILVVAWISELTWTDLTWQGLEEIIVISEIRRLLAIPALAKIRYGRTTLGKIDRWD